MRAASRLLLIIVVLSVSGWPGQTGVSAPLFADDPVVVVSSTVDQLVVAFNFVDPQFQDVRLLDGGQYTEVRAPGAGFPSIGMPAVPVFGVWILIPNGRAAFVDVIEPGDSQPLRENLRLAPVQPPRADVEDAPLGPFSLDETIYHADADYPGDLARLDEPEMLRGQTVARLWLYPYQYNPQAGRLVVYPNLIVTIQFASPERQPDLSPQPIPWRLKSAAFERIYKKMAINANEVLAVENEVAQPVPVHPYGWNYIILTNSALKSAANQLAAWKQQQGHSVWVEELPANYSAANLKNALLGAYQNWDIAPEYILILGDSDVVIPNYKTWHPYNGTLNNNIRDSQGYTGTDLYYSTLESSVPNDPDADLQADVLIGRMSVDSLTEAQSRVEGSVNYEKSPTLNSSFYNTAVLAADFSDGATYYIELPSGVLSPTHVAPNGIEDRRFTQTAEDIALYLTDVPENKTISRQYYAASNVTPAKWNDDKQFPQEFKNFAGASTSVGGPIPSDLLRSNGFNWDADGTAISSAINSGAFLVLHRGHGGRDHWGNPYYWNASAFLLNNEDKLPVVWSINCQTGWFDNETDMKLKAGLTDWTSNIDEALSERFERPYLGYSTLPHDYGAVGVVAASRVSYSGYNEYLTLGMGDAIWPDLLKGGGIPGLGSETVMASVLDLAKSYMLTKYSLDSYALADIEGYHWFGDPALEIRTSMPDVIMQMVAPPLYTWLFLKHDLTIQVNQLPTGGAPDGPLADVKVSLSNPAHPQQVWTAYSDAEGQAIFHDLELKEPGEYNLLAWLSNTTPVSQTIAVQPGSEGGIGWDNWSYTCADTAGVLVADADLAGTGLLNVSLSTANGDAETLRLEETQAGYFTGSIPTELRRPNPQDNQLQVRDGEQITAVYDETSPGAAPSSSRPATATIDCSPPIFAGLQSIAGVCPAILAWQPASDLNGPVQYRIYRSQSPDDLSDALFSTTWATDYPDTTCFKGEYFYRVRAVDRLGNEDENIATISLTVPGLFLPVIRR